MLVRSDLSRPWRGFIYFAFTAWLRERALVKSELSAWSDFKRLYVNTKW